MKIIGVIAEYNPFHNGHAYQLKQIKQKLHADYVVVAMSGNFVQRGAPAIIDKYARTEMALSCGADLVIELPALWATASAEYFAMAGVTLFEKMGCVSGICFGAETDDFDTLSKISNTLVEEPDSYRLALSSYLKEGFSFPSARSKALYDYFSSQSVSGTHSNNKVDLNLIASILNEPNNILAIEYLKALKRRNSSMTPHIIKREGAGYHEETINNLSSYTPNTDVSVTDAYIPTASATAIRNELSNQVLTSMYAKPIFSYNKLSHAMPQQALNILKKYLETSTLIFINDFSPTLCYKLICTNVKELAAIGDSNTDLANRILKNSSQFVKFEQFCELCKSKEVTYARLSRIFTHFILDITEDDYAFGKLLDYVPYLRILGFKKDVSVLLKELKYKASSPVISKLANASYLLGNDAMQILQKDIFASDLYARICAIKTETVFGNEFTRNIVIL